jgi:hypothetical protein
MRLIVAIVVGASLLLGAYVVLTGYILARVATGILTVGTVAAALGTAPPPDDPRDLGWRGTPEQAFGLPFRTVVIDTPLGPSEAWFVPAAGPERGRAIYVHGIAGAREDGYRHLPLLHAAGWSVLLVSYRNDVGAPASPDGRYGFGLTEWPDLEAAVRWLAAEPTPADPGLLVVAESMGAAILGQFLARSDAAKAVAAVALDSPALSLTAVLHHLAQAGGRPLPGATAWAAAQFLPMLTGLQTGDAETAATTAAFAGPLFLAHGSADRIVPFGPSQALAATRSGSTTVLWTGADHLGSHAEDPAAYAAAFTRFLAVLRP